MALELLEIGQGLPYRRLLMVATGERLVRVTVGRLASIVQIWWVSAP